MRPQPPLLSVAELACVRGSKRIFSGLNFETYGGDCLEVRGANGAGKSSLLRLLAGLDEPAEGSVRLTEGYHYVGHLDAVKSVLTVRENLGFWARLMGTANIDAALHAFSLGSLADDPAGILSQGQKRRLALSRLLIAWQAVWLLDEPTVGLDAASLDQLRSLITAHRAKGGLVVAATHVSLELPDTKTIALGARKAVAWARHSVLCLRYWSWCRCPSALIRPPCSAWHPASCG
jgi:heme exporter protein A